jgi:hypothetical protein
MNLRLFLTTFAFVAISILSSVLPAKAVTPIQGSLTVQLLTLAQSKLDAEYNVLISGDATKLTKANFAMSGAITRGLSNAANSQIELNKILADHGEHYTKAVSKLTVEKMDVSGDNATITAKEYSTRTLVDKYAKDPVDTKEEITHTFHYVLQSGQWTLTEDNVVNPFVPVSPEPGMPKVTGKPISFDTSTKSTASSQRSKFSNASANSMTTATMHGTYNPTTAANYAISYWNNYNSAYRAYGNDCTNFVSQSSNWAGWQHIGGWYLDDNNWWYSPNPMVTWGNKTESRSWVNVQDYYFFARNSGRAFNAQYQTDFTVGDTLQVDFSKPDGILDHNTIVTRDDGNGNIFLTYHSNNTLNMSIWEFYYRTPGANYYGTLYYYTY